MLVKPTSVDPNAPLMNGWYRAKPVTSEVKFSQKTQSDFYAIDFLVTCGIGAGKHVKASLLNAFQTVQALVALGELVDDETARKITPAQVDAMPAFNVEAEHFMNDQSCWILVEQRDWNGKKYANVVKYSRFAPPGIVEIKPSTVVPVPIKPLKTIARIPEAWETPAEQPAEYGNLGQSEQASNITVSDEDKARLAAISAEAKAKIAEVDPF